MERNNRLAHARNFVVWGYFLGIKQLPVHILAQRPQFPTKVMKFHAYLASFSRSDAKQTDRWQTQWLLHKALTLAHCKPNNTNTDHTHTHTTVLQLCGFCLGQPGWAGTRRNIHPLTCIVVINHPNTSTRTTGQKTEMWVYNNNTHCTASFPAQPAKPVPERQNHSGFSWSKKWWGGSGISWTICKSFAFHSRQITNQLSQLGQ